MVLRNCEELTSILDVGPGHGIWYELLAQWYPDAIFHAIEIFEPYIERYGLRKKYHFVYNEDVRTGIPYSVEWDLVIFGDVLEHMKKAEADKVVRTLLHKWALISIPIGECPQDGTEENPYEEHVATWTVEDILTHFPVKPPYFCSIDPPPLYGRGVFLLEKQ